LFMSVGAQNRGVSEDLLRVYEVDRERGQRPAVPAEAGTIQTSLN
jgi:hypothetical protein